MFTTDGRVLVRRGTENVPALPHQITALASRRGQLHYEAETPPGATLGDLDLGLLENYCATYEKKRGRRLMLPDLKLLEHLGTVVYRDDKPHPTVAGLLVFGRDVWRHRDTAHRELRELVRKGLIQRRGQGRMIHYISTEDRTISG